jgi:hypothetical protein
MSNPLISASWPSLAEANPNVPVHVQSELSENDVNRQDFTLRCPAGEAEAQCKLSFPTVTASSHEGVDLTPGMTEAIFKMVPTTEEPITYTSQQILGDQIDYDNPGEYLFTYNAVDEAGNPAEELTFALMIDDRQAPVIDVCPSLMRTTPIEAGSAWQVCASDSTDNVDGDISPYITYDVTNSLVGGPTAHYTSANALSAAVNSWTLGDWEIVIKSTDAAENEATETVNILVEDSTPPSITVHGTAPATVECMATYTDTWFNGDVEVAGATASDTYDDYQGLAVQVDSSITGPTANPAPADFDAMTSIVGDYTIHYTATDSEENPAAAASRPVEVHDHTVPVLDLNGFSTDQVHYSGGTFDAPTVTCSDACDSEPALTEEWVAGFGVPTTYDPDLPDYTKVLDGDLEDSGCTTVCQDGTTPCGHDCVSDTCAENPINLSVGDWSTCSQEVWSKLNQHTAEDGKPTHFALDLSAYGQDKVHDVKFVKRYTCSDHEGLSVTQDVTYTVQDNSKPTFNLELGNQQLSATLDEAWEDPGYSCSDYTDGDIDTDTQGPAGLTITYGATGAPNRAVADTYVVNYVCCNSAGLCADEASRTVEVDDDVCPTIELVGNPIEVVEASFPWVEPGYTVTDDVTSSEDMTVEVDGADEITTSTAFKAFRSCAEIKSVFAEASSGEWTITVETPERLEAKRVVCDMSTDGVTYFKIDGQGAIKPYGSDGGLCAENGFAMPQRSDLTAYTEQHFGPGFFPSELQSTDQYLCWQDPSVELTFDAHHVDEHTIKFATQGVYTITYHTQDAAGNPECRPAGVPITRKVVVKDTLAPRIVIKRPDGSKYSMGSIGDAQTAKLATLPDGEEHQGGLPSQDELADFLADDGTARRLRGNSAAP